MFEIKRERERSHFIGVWKDIGWILCDVDVGNLKVNSKINNLDCIKIIKLNINNNNLSSSKNFLKIYYIECKLKIKLTSKQ